MSQRAGLPRLEGMVKWFIKRKLATLSLEISGDQVLAIYAVRNPDKLRHLS